MGSTKGTCHRGVWKEEGVDVPGFPNCLGVKARMGPDLGSAPPQLCSTWRRWGPAAAHSPSRPQISAPQGDKQWWGRAMSSFLFCYHNFLLIFLTKHWGGTEAGRLGLAWGGPQGSPTTSQPLPPGPAQAETETLLGAISYYQEGAGEGRLRVCRQAALACRAQRLLGTGASLQLYLLEDVAHTPRTPNSREASSPTQHVCHELVWALEFLKLISVNLLLFPWRKEIRSLKVGTAMHLSKGVSGRALFWGE